MLGTKTKKRKKKRKKKGKKKEEKKEGMCEENEHFMVFGKNFILST